MHIRGVKKQFMNTKKRLNCYVFSNLMISLLSFNFLIQKDVSNVDLKRIEASDDSQLVAIYDRGIVAEFLEDIDLSSSTNESQNTPVVIAVSNKTVETPRETYNYVKPSYNSVTGMNVVNYAKRYLGLPYIHAGRSLSKGTDCSGFTSLIFQEFGISLGKTVSSQLYSGSYVSRNDLQPGDLVFYSYGSIASHVAIYIGDGLIIHESNPRDGCKISSVNIMNYITARRVITSNVVSPKVETANTVVETPIQEVPVVPDNSNQIVEEITKVDLTNENNNTEVVNEIVESEVIEEPIKEVEEIIDISSNVEKEEIVQEENKKEEKVIEEKVIEESE